MRIALDGIPLSQPLTGIGHYTLQLARELAQDSADDQVSVISPRPFEPSAQSSSHPNGPTLVRVSFNPFVRTWWRSGLPRYLRRNGFNIFHGTNYELPTKAPCPRVVTIHDLSTLLYPQTHESKNVKRARERLPLVVKNADRIITPTEAVRAEVAEHLRIPSKQIVAIPEAAREFFKRVSLDQTRETRQRFGIGEEFLLYVGTVEPRKNLKTLLTAFQDLANNRSDLQLVISGRRGWMVDDLIAYAKHSPASGRIIFTGYLGDHDLRSLYSSCRLFVYPSIYEGFGLPPLEAMACGAPVVASAIPSITEVVGDAALLVEPANVNLLSETIAHLLGHDDERQALAAKGIERVAKFSWKRTAQLTRAVYEQVV